jgi:hypothetical protein
MKVAEKQTRDETDPHTLKAPEVVKLLVGGVRPLDYGMIPLTSWPCLLVAAVAEVSEQTQNLTHYSWRRDIGVNAEVAVVQNELTLDTASASLPDTFDADVFAVLVAKAVINKEAYGFLHLREVVEYLRLNPEETEDYKRVDEAIWRLCGMSIYTSSSVGSRIPRVRPKSNSNMTRYVSGFRLINRYETPGNGDFQGQPVRIQWNENVYDAITATPLASTGASLSEIPL